MNQNDNQHKLQKQAQLPQQQQNIQQQSIKDNPSKSFFQYNQSFLQSLSQSQHKHDYSVEMSTITTELSRLQSLNRLLQKGIFQQQPLNKAMIMVKNIQNSKYLQIVQVQMNIVIFNLKVRIITINRQSPYHKCPKINKDYNYGNLYQFQTNDAKGKHHKVIKCLEQGSKELSDLLIQAINQYCLLKIASILECGPKIDQHCFDITIFKCQRKDQEVQLQNKTTACVQFCMERCQVLEKDKLNENQLMSKLKTLHNINFAHSDIKPLNIMFSPSYNSCVFIDFGISSFLRQPVGYKSRVKYKGTLNFSSLEMRKIYNRTEFSYIDLYWNDLYGLKLSMAAINENSSQEDQGEDEQILNEEVESNENAIIIQQAEKIALKIKSLRMMLDLKYKMYFENLRCQKTICQMIAQMQEQDKQELAYFVMQEKMICEGIMKMLSGQLLKMKIQLQQSEAIMSNLFNKTRSINRLVYKQTYNSTKSYVLRQRHSFFNHTFEKIQYLNYTSYNNRFLLKIFAKKRQQIVQTVNMLTEINNKSSKQQKSLFQDQRIYDVILFNIVDFTKRKYNISFKNKGKACQIFYKVNNKQDKNFTPLEYIQSFIQTILLKCLKNKQYPLNRRFIQVYSNYLLLGLANQQIVRLVYNTIDRFSAQKDTMCDYFLQIYQLNFWLQQHIDGKKNLNFIKIKRYIVKKMYSIYKHLQIDEQNPHLDCIKGDNICEFAQQHMLQAIRRRSNKSLLRPLQIQRDTESGRNESFLQRVNRVCQVIQNFKNGIIGIDGDGKIRNYSQNKHKGQISNINYYKQISQQIDITYHQIYQTKQKKTFIQFQQNQCDYYCQVYQDIPFHLFSYLFIKQFFLIAPSSWATLTYYTQLFIASASISLRWQISFYEEMFYHLQDQIDSNYFSNRQQKMRSWGYNIKSIHKCQAYGEIIYFLQSANDSLLRPQFKSAQRYYKDARQQFIKLVQQFSENQLADYLLNLNHQKSEWIWLYLSYIATQESLKVMRIVTQYYQKIQSLCQARKRYKTMNCLSFCLIHDIKIDFIEDGQGYLLNEKQNNQNELLIKLNYLSKMAAKNSLNIQRKQAYLKIFYELGMQKQAFQYYITYKINNQVYLDIIAMLIRQKEYEKTINFITFITSIYTEIITQKIYWNLTFIHILLQNLFLKAPLVYMTHWMPFRDVFMRKLKKERHLSLNFYALTIAHIQFRICKYKQNLISADQISNVIKTHVMLQLKLFLYLLYSFSLIIDKIALFFYRYHEFIYYQVFSFIAKRCITFPKRYYKFIINLHKKKMKKILQPFSKNDQLHKCMKILGQYVRQKYYSLTIYIDQKHQEYNSGTTQIAHKMLRAKLDKAYDPFHILMKRNVVYKRNNNRI